LKVFTLVSKDFKVTRGGTGVASKMPIWWEWLTSGSPAPRLLEPLIDSRIYYESTTPRTRLNCAGNCQTSAGHLYLYRIQRCLQGNQDSSG